MARSTRTPPAPPAPSPDGDELRQRRHAFAADLGRLLADLYIDGQLDHLLDEDSDDQPKD